MKFKAKVGVFLCFIAALMCTCAYAKAPEKSNRKPDVYFCTYGNERFKQSRKRIAKEAENLKYFKKVKVFTEKDITPEFKKKYNDILTQRRGGGYWAWKFDVMEQMMNSCKEGDYILYSDAGSSIKKGFGKEVDGWVRLLERSKYKNLSFQMKYKENEWTVNELFELLKKKYPKKRKEIENIKKGGQFMATMMFMKNDAHSREIIKSCKELIDCDHKITTDAYSEKNRKKFNNFHDNRHDQSVLSCIRKLLGTTSMNESKIKFWAATRIRK